MGVGAVRAGNFRKVSDRVCAGMDITGAVERMAGQRTALKLMGALDGGVGE